MLPRLLLIGVSTIAFLTFLEWLRQNDEKEREREIERKRKKDRQAAEEARLKAERAAVEKAHAEARERAGRAAAQWAQAEAAERAAVNARERAAEEARQKAERAAVEKARAEALERERRAAAQRAQAEATESSNSTKYVLEQNDQISISVIPKEIKRFFEKDIAPDVLKKPLSHTTYRDSFAALLYAEDFYFERWNNYSLCNVLLELHDAAMYKKPERNKILTEIDFDTKYFVAFEIDSIPENRPFLLSRDFVLLRPSGKQIEPFKGFLYRVVKRNIVVADFGDDFHSQHVPSRKYDVSFSFNRICLKRCHQAISAATDPSFQGFLFPEHIIGTTYLHPNSHHSSLNRAKELALQRILSLRGPPPYLIKGPLSVTDNGELSKTGLFIQEAVLQIYRTSPDCRILITSPTNKKCDTMMRSLEIPDSEILRVNAAFREYLEVPDDILPACRYDKGCFTCPSQYELRNFKVTSSTFMSCFRLYNEGIRAGHYSHIFLVDASSATEPEAMVALANLVGQRTAVIVTGDSGDSSRWVRSDISRKYGLKVSYFERLMQNEPYLSSDPRFVYDLEVEPKLQDYSYRDIDFDWHLAM